MILSQFFLHQVLDILMDFTLVLIEHLDLRELVVRNPHVWTLRR